MVDKPPTEDPIMRTGQRAWELKEHRPNLTMSRGAFKTYSTFVHSTTFFSIECNCLHFTASSPK